MSEKINKIIIGIDPGVEGAITIIDLQQNKVTIYKMPETPSGIQEILFTYTDLKDYHIVCEAVHSSPQMGVSTAFKFGRVFGWLEGLLHRYDKTEFISPVRWQRALNCLTGGDKKISRDRAKQLFPDAKGLNLKTADSALIAYYGYVKYGKR